MDIFLIDVVVFDNTALRKGDGIIIIIIRRNNNGAT
jgi:hypothetical protein